MRTEDFTKDVLSQIKDQKITPRPHWQYSLKNYGLWFLACLSTILGALAVTVIIFILTDCDWDVFTYLDHNFWYQVIISLPYLWLASLMLLVAVIFYNLRHTKGGYRYGAYKIIGFSILVSVLLGIIMFYGGLGSQINEGLTSRLPMYGRLVRTNRNLWAYPEHGLLAGNIKLINGDQGFIVEDLNGMMWMVATDTQTIWDCCGGRVATNTVIKMIGKKQGDHNFRAKNIRPWKKSPPPRPSVK